MPTVTVNETELYHEVRGSGPPILLIMGATGDGGHFERQCGRSSKRRWRPADRPPRWGASGAT
jgi:pimeloyl-ACP methyl ester carboxylesterase